MAPLSIVCIELFALYILSRQVTQKLFTVFLILFRAQTLAMTLILVLEFPGTVIHELAHLFTAEILRVHTGKMTLVPESLRSGEIKAGSVLIAESDPFRRYIIGLAPIFSGLISLTALSYFLSNPDLFGISVPKFSIFNFQFSIISVICFYLLFAVSNTMFSSKQDLEGFLPFAIVVGMFATGFYVVGIRIMLTGQVLAIVNQVTTTLAKSLGVVIGLNIVILILTYFIMSTITRIRQVKIVS